MAPMPWRGLKRDTPALRDGARGHAREPQGVWSRRYAFAALVLGQTGVATYWLTDTLPQHHTPAIETVIVALFALLFAWVSAGFWTGVAGFWTLLRGRDPFSISRSISKDAAGNAPIDPNARTAIIMPICNEDVGAVFANIRATWESVERAGAREH
ncbi:MAG TPA: hypothetical protein VFS42_08145, partial [Burkholderiaceae bacterium]|nr:hypothetical protein [Burkholderiaceae bacterium]